MRLRGALLAIALVAALAPSVPAAQPACAASADHAALVIEAPAKVLRYCVALDQPSVTGLHLIELAHDQYGLSYRFDGAAVCMLAGTGPTEGDCFGDYPNFWGYWRGTGSGGWVWAGSGAASTAVHSGGVEGWSWGTGDVGASHHPPPVTKLASVCPSQASATPAPTPHRTHHAPRSASPSPAPAAAPGPTKSPSPRPSRARHRRREARPAPRLTPAHRKGAPRAVAGRAEKPAASTSGGGSLPTGAVVAVLLAAAMTVTGWVLGRRRAQP